MRRFVSVLGCVALLWAASGSLRAVEAHPQYVLLLHSFDRDLAPYDRFVDVFRAELSRNSPSPIVFVEVSVRPKADQERPSDDVLVRSVQSAYRTQTLSLVVTIG